MAKENLLLSAYLAKVQSEDSIYKRQVHDRIAIRTAKYRSLSGDPSCIHSHNLFDPLGNIFNPIMEYAKSCGPNLVLDISSLPKRFFFPITKWMLNCRAIKNLIVVYTLPRKHPGVLAENFQPWKAIPSFDGEYGDHDAKDLILSIGYLASGLPDHLDEESSSPQIHLLFPFPPGPPSFQRSWELVRRLRTNINPERILTKQVNAIDLNDAYDHILSISDSGRRPVALAPFGPKPISMAMAIFASRFNQPVFYTQPESYHHDYSIGVAKINGTPQIYAYCIRLDGRDLYDSGATHLAVSRDGNSLDR
ncbi:MAG TPA: hypothetical protein PKE12_05430 [Kiritimatiellia bacterium]|nr:hypothetical protein [Kiritimatiellia bacterium]